VFGCLEVAAGAQIVYRLKWELGRGNGVVKVRAGAEPENTPPADENRFLPDGSKTTQSLEIFEVRGNYSYTIMCSETENKWPYTVPAEQIIRTK